jgi:glyoxylase-like metal-dependent hydrolase (beta-lactamase superfamily II)
MDILLETFTVGPLLENAYLLAHPPSRTAVFVDPGDEAERLISALETRGLSLAAIWLSHAHFDHVGAVAALKERYGAPVFLHPADDVLLEHASASAAQWGIPLRQPPRADQTLEDGQVLTLGGLEAHCLFTPGHAPGHVAFYLPELSTVLAGDALFQGSIGRTDLPFGDHAQLISSIKTKLLTLPPETKVLPGHGPATTIGAEARSNPFLG